MVCGGKVMLKPAALRGVTVMSAVGIEPDGVVMNTSAGVNVVPSIVTLKVTSAAATQQATVPCGDMASTAGGSMVRELSVKTVPVPPAA